MPARRPVAAPRYHRRSWVPLPVPSRRHHPARGPALRVYVTGDTLLFDDIRSIPRRFPGIDLALLHLGGTRAVGILVTMDAAQGVDLVRTVDPATAVPIHYDDYTVFTSPLEDFRHAVDAAGRGSGCATCAAGTRTGSPFLGPPTGDLTGAPSRQERS